MNKADDKKSLLKKKRHFLAISAPSGGGKSTVCKKILGTAADFCLSISHTTRSPRPGEADGREYFFVSRDEFQELIDAGQFIEWAEYNGNLYGTSRKFLEDAARDERIVLLDIDIQGVQSLQRDYPQETLSIFLQPPNEQVLEERLRNRATDSDKDIAGRLAIARQEMQGAHIYDHQVINDTLEKTVDAVLAIVRNEIGGLS